MRYAMHTLSSVVAPFSFSALRTALVGIFGGRPREVDDHLKKKTGDRAPNRAHCQAVCSLAVLIDSRDRTTLVRYAQAVDAASPGRVLMAGTGRPFRNRQSGLSDGAQAWADQVASQILSDLAAMAGIERPDCRYNNAPILPASAQAVSLAPTPETAPAPEAAPDTEAAPAAPDTEAAPVKGRGKRRNR
jgi:hypothetical protein